MGQLDEVLGHSSELMAVFESTSQLAHSDILYFALQSDVPFCTFLHDTDVALFHPRRALAFGVQSPAIAIQKLSSAIISRRMRGKVMCKPSIGLDVFEEETPQVSLTLETSFVHASFNLVSSAPLLPGTGPASLLKT